MKPQDLNSFGANQSVRILEGGGPPFLNQFRTPNIIPIMLGVFVRRVGLRGLLHLLSFLGKFVGLSLHICHLSRQQHSAYFEVPAQRGSQARTACVAERLEPKAVPLRLLNLTPPRFDASQISIAGTDNKHGT